MVGLGKRHRQDARPHAAIRAAGRERGNAREVESAGAVPGQTPDYVELFEQAPAGYMLLDAEGCIEQINGPGAALLGWAPSWLAGKFFVRWVAVEDKQRFRAYRQNLCGREDCSSLDLRIKNRQGRFISLRLEGRRQTATDDGAADCGCLMLDRTDEQQTAREVRHLHAQLQRATRLQTAGELATSLAHELNQPLATVVLNCESALRLLNSGSGADCEFAESLSQAVEAASFASEVVGHLRGFLRDSGESRELCTLSALVRGAATLIAGEARDHDVELQLDIDEDMATVRADPVHIEQVLVNLTHNSIEAIAGDRNAGRADGITIRARQASPEQVQVSVVDTGPGLSASELDKLCSPFHTTKRDGLGLGLAISRTIIDAHGGRLWASDQSGAGASVHFTLPTAACHAE